jgi:hypothetical protein
MVNTVAELIDTLGGTTAVAILLRTPQPSVSRAKSQNRIPAPWRLPLWLAAEHKGISFDKRMFEQ